MKKKLILNKKTTTACIMYFSKDIWIVYHMNNIWWKKQLKSDWGLINPNLKLFNIF